MTKVPVTYVLEGKFYEAGLWSSIQFTGRRGVPYTGSGAKARAIDDGEVLSKMTIWCVISPHIYAGLISHRVSGPKTKRVTGRPDAATCSS